MIKLSSVSILIIAWVLVVLFAMPVVASTEYAIPNSSITIGISDNAGINVSYSSIQPSLGVRVYSDTINETWCIPPDKSPDGLLDIIIVSVEQPGFWSWLPWI